MVTISHIQILLNSNQMNKTYDEYHQAVCNNGLALKDVPYDIIDEDIIYAALADNRLAFQYIPTDKINIDILCTSIDPSLYDNDINDLDDFMKYVSIDTLTNETYKSMLSINGIILKYIPISKLNNDLILASIDQYSRCSLKYVPNDMFTDELCLNIVKCNGKALKYIPIDKRTEKVIFQAVSNNGYALQYVPTEQMTDDIILAAVKRHGEFLQFVPTEKQTSKICREAVLSYCDAIKYIKITPNDDDLDTIGRYMYSIHANRAKYHILGYERFLECSPFARLN